MKWALPILGSVLSLSASVAAAQQPSQAQVSAIKQSCRSDYESYCASVPTGGRASLQCLQQHLDALSSSCHEAVAAVSGGSASRPPPGAQSGGQAQAVPRMSPRQEAILVRRDCGGDFNAYCSDVRIGGGRGIACLMRNERRLSPQCQGALSEARQSR